MVQNFYPVVQRWADASDEERGPFKNFVKALIGEECLIACVANNGWVDIYVKCPYADKVKNWLEVQPSGAIGVTFDSYPEPEAYEVMHLSDRCDDFNTELGVEFLDDSDEEDSDGGDSE